jgi:hypothetical protein
MQIKSQVVSLKSEMVNNHKYLLIVLSAFLLLGYTNEKPSFTNQKQHKICWEQDRLLSWKDYLGNRPGGAQYAAMTNISLQCEILSSNSILVSNCMVKEKSWVREKSKSSYILNHEQYHFNLAEVFARKMRKEFTDLSTVNYHIVDSIFQKVYSDYDAAQVRYDDETLHSQVNAEQIKWQDKIDEELAVLDAYKETVVYLNKLSSKRLVRNQKSTVHQPVSIENPKF